MSIDLVLLGTMVLLVTPTAVELSTWMGVFGCGQPISMSVCLMGTNSLAVMKSAANSASAADDMTNLMILASVMIGPLSRGMASFSEQKMYAPARLRDFVTFRYAASECAAITMSLARNVMPTFGYVAM